MDNVRLSNCIYINMTHGFENMKQAFKSDSLSLKERIATFALGLFEIILLPGFGTALTYLDCKYLKTKVKEEPKQEEQNPPKGNFWTKAKACAVIAMCVIAPAVGFIAYNWMQPAQVNQPMCGLNEKPVNGTLVDNSIDCPNPHFQASVVQPPVNTTVNATSAVEVGEVKPIVHNQVAIQYAAPNYNPEQPQCSVKNSPWQINNLFGFYNRMAEELKQEQNAVRGA